MASAVTSGYKRGADSEEQKWRDLYYNLYRAPKPQAVRRRSVKPSDS